MAHRMSTLSARPVLNYDILLAIMSQCDSQSTISRMMQTCRYLSDKGDRYLLRNGVTIRSVSALHGFFRFLEPEGSDGVRLRFLRGLTLEMQDVRGPLAARLVELVARMTHLENLALVHSEYILKNVPGLSEAICNLRSLRNLSIGSASRKACETLQGLRSPLEQCTLRSYASEDEASREPFRDSLRVGKYPEYHPTVLCEAFSTSLQELTVVYGCLGPTIRAFDPPAIYPNLRRLSLTNPERTAHTYIRAFPNLEWLALWSHHEMHEQCGRLERVPINYDLEKVRARNIAQREAHGTWEHLQECTGDVQGLFILDLTCHVPRLSIAYVGRQHV